MHMRTIASFLALALFAHPALAQAVVNFESAAESLRGPLVALEADRVRATIDGKARTLTGVVELRRANVELPALPTRNFALLTNGDRIPLDPEATPTLVDGRVHLVPAKSLGLAGKPLSVFAPHIVLLFWSIPEGVDDAELFLAKLEKDSRPRDVAFLTNGDRVEGILSDMTAKDGCTITTGDRKVQIGWAKLAGLAWNTERPARLRTKKTYWRAVLAGGPRLNLLDLRLDEKTQRWTGTTQFGPTLDLPEASILALDQHQGNAVDLADVTPMRYEHRPYLGVPWPLALDAAATGHPLRLADSSYERGLGMHATSEVVYALDGKYQRFLSLVGIDERSRRGRARVAVLLDGKRVDLNEGRELTADMSPLSVRLDVSGIRMLTLRVEAGVLGDVQANVNWAKARLLKK